MGNGGDSVPRATEAQKNFPGAPGAQVGCCSLFAVSVGGESPDWGGERGGGGATRTPPTLPCDAMTDSTHFLLLRVFHDHDRG